jgi:hypothetical protein
MKNEIKESWLKKNLRKIIIGFIISFFASIASFYYFILPEKRDKSTEKISKEAVITTLEKITLPPHILFHKVIKDCTDSPGPVKDGNNPYGDKILNIKKVLEASVEVDVKALLRVESFAGCTIDRFKYDRYKNQLNNNTGSIGFLINRIKIDEIDRNGDSRTAVDPLQPGLYSNCAYSYMVEKGTYKIKVEVIFYGFLANPNPVVKVTGERAEPVNLRELLKKWLEKEKRSLLLDYTFKNKNQTFDQNKPGGIQPSVGGPTANRNHEAQTQKKTCVSYEVKYPEAVKGQR